ncbi:MAG: DUF5683 domain-containing protein [Balneolales bacterium]
MMNWIASLRYLIPLRELGIGLFLLLFCDNVFAQELNDIAPAPKDQESIFSDSTQEMQSRADSVPEPKKVMLRSAMIPGWGQLTNKQVWKIPIVYGLIVGAAYYTLNVHGAYNDYRAAYYNTHSDDEKFGPTPETINPNVSPEYLRNHRNLLRSRRDYALGGILLAYGLNVVDAYVYAQFRDFDVSDDLSGRIGVKPGWTPDQKPFVSLSFRLSFQ